MGARSLLNVALVASLAVGSGVMPATAGVSTSSPDGASRTVSASRAQGRRLESAEALLRGLIRRSLALQDSSPLQAGGALPPSPSRRDVGGSEMSREVQNRMAGYRRLLDGAPARPRLASRLGPVGRARSGVASAPATDLASYVSLLARTSPKASVSGRFTDWRSPSVYRRAAGRHNGYDVSLAAGQPALAGWPGHVTAVTPWYGREFGVTVVSPQGFSTTYGHIAPCVRVGMRVEPGDILGLVVVDHVDVKMRDSAGRFFDFARGVPGDTVATSTPPTGPVVSVALPEPLRAPPSLKGPDWAGRPEAVAAAIAYTRLRHQEVSLLVSGADRSGLAAVRREIAECRSRLSLHGVPEEVILAAFLEAPPDVCAALSIGDVADRKPAVAGLGDTLRRQQVLGEARESTDRMRALVRDLGE